MDSRFFIGIVLCSILSSTYAGASIIDFQSSPTRIEPLLTDLLTMMCTLEDTMTSPSGSSLVGKRTTSTEDNLLMVTSMVVMRNGGDHVATITPVSAAKPLLDTSNMAVTGDMNMSGHGGHLTLTWKYPTVEQAGMYICEVNGINKNGHNVVFTKTLEVNITLPTAADLVKYIHDLKVENVEQKNEISDLTSQASELKNEIDGLASENGDMKNDISGLHTKTDQLQNQVDGLQTENGQLKSQITAINSRIDQVVNNAKRPPTLRNCQWTGWLNNWDAQYTWDAPSGHVIIGTGSYHNNGAEDRRFRFHHCSLSAP